jgi:acetylornithine deacetylase
MPASALEDIRSILATLVAFDTTSDKSNLALIDWVRDYLAGHGIASDKLSDPTGTKAALWATIGPPDTPGYILSGHTDVVTPEGQVWTNDPFTLTERDGRCYGRGTCDMKGFIAVCLALAPETMRAPLRTPIHFAFSHDEEVGCKGVAPLIERHCMGLTRPLGCFVGEPTGMGVIVGHKGKHAMHVTVRGRAAHSSLPDAGVNAIEIAADIITHVRTLAAGLAKSGERDPLYDVPHSTGLTAIVKGGTANNIIPSRCELEFEFRTIAGDDAVALSKGVEAWARAELEPAMKARDPACGIEFEEALSYPGLETDPEHPIVRLAKRLAGRNDHGKVAFGTEAGLFAAMAGIASVVVGPGSIAQAHRPDEYVEAGELMKCVAFVRALIAHCAEGPSY